jgi:hypothetical protein
MLLIPDNLKNISLIAAILIVSLFIFAFSFFQGDSRKTKPEKSNNIESASETKSFQEEVSPFLVSERKTEAESENQTDTEPQPQTNQEDSNDSTNETELEESEPEEGGLTEEISQYLKNIFKDTATERSQEDINSSSGCSVCNERSNTLDEGCRREMDKILAQTPYDDWNNFENSDIYEETMNEYHSSEDIEEAGEQYRSAQEETEATSFLGGTPSFLCSVLDKGIFSGLSFIKTAKAALGCNCGDCCNSYGCHCIPPCCCACCPACCR